MEIHSYRLPSGIRMYYGLIKKNLGIKQAFFESTSRRVLLTYMFQGL